MNCMAVAELPGLAEVLVKVPADTLLSRLPEVLPEVVKDSGDAHGCAVWPAEILPDRLSISVQKDKLANGRISN